MKLPNLNDKIVKILIIKNDNINDQSIDGYEITFHFESGYTCTIIETSSYIDELEDQPRGIFEYIDNKYIQIENWD